MTRDYKTWPPREVTSLRNTLRSLVEVVEDEERDLSEESRTWLARLLVVRATGFLEQVIVECFRGHVREKSGGLVRSFAVSWLEKSKSPSPQSVLDAVGRFDNGLRIELEEFLDADDERLKRELHFLVATRHKIAHGHNEGIGPTRALRLVDIAVEIADWFILKFNPLR